MSCLDSDILIDYLRNNKESISLISSLRNKGEDLSITSINSFELFKGLAKSSKLTEQEILDFLSNFNVLDFDYGSSKKAAEIFNKLKEEGDMLDVADIMIAATVITNGKFLITRNKKHFSRISELKLEEI